jgi:methylaspartate mutase sigma subunit
MKMARSPTAVVSGTSSDSHMWNIVFLQLLLQETGVEVVNLGVCVPDRLLLDACLDRRPDLVAIGTVNGHGYHDGLRVVRKLRVRRELDGTAIVIGGKLGVAGDLAASRRDALLRAGFDGVFEGEGAVGSFLDLITGTVAVAAQ